MKRSSVIKVACAILVVGIAFYWWKSHASQAKSVAEMNLGTVVRGDLVQRVTISGQIWPKKRLDVRPSFPGYLQKLFVKVGQQVKPGDPLATFSPSLTEGETNFPVRANFVGIVTAVSKTEGEQALDTGDSTMVLRVEDLTEFFVHATVPELDVAKIKLGQEAKARISALPNETFLGEITEIGLSAKDKDRWSSSSTEFPVVIRLKSHDTRLFPGMTAILDVITSKRPNTLSIGHEYVQEDDKGSFVLLPGKVRQDVKLGLQTDEAVEILAGLTEGQKVLPVDFLNLPKVEE